MTFAINGHLFRKAVLWVAPLGLLSATALNAHWEPSYGYYDDHDYGVRGHQRDEKRALKQHQRQERWYYGDSWALRQHQKEERRRLKHHQWRERDHDDSDGYRWRDGYRDRGWYDDRRY